MSESPLAGWWAGFRRRPFGAPLSTWVAVLLWLGLVLVAFRTVTFGGRSLMAALGYPGITATGPVGQDRTDLPVADYVPAYIDEPQAVLAARQMAAGEFPLWNPHNALGVPLFGSWQCSIPSPLRMLTHAYPGEPWAVDATYLIRLFVAGLGALLLALHLGLSPPAALAAGSVFGLSGYFVFYIQMHHLNCEVLLPWLWLCADRLGRVMTPGRVLGFALTVFCTTVGGNPQPTLVLFAATALFGLARWRSWGMAGLVRVGVVAVPAVLLAAHYWLSGLEYVRESVHHHEVPHGGDHYTLGSALGFFVPMPFDKSQGLVAPYFGVLPFALALIGIGYGLGRSVFLWALAVVGIGKLLGAPVAQWLGDVPGFSLVKLWKYLYAVPTLALALLAGGGIARLRHVGCSMRVLVLGVSFVFAAWGVTLISALQVVDAVPKAPNGEPFFDVVWSKFWRPAGLLLALPIVVVWLRRGVAPEVGMRRVALAGAAMVCLEAVTSPPTAWPERVDAFAKPSYLQAFRKLTPGSFRTYGQLGVMMPNQNAVLNVDDIRLHDGVFPARYGRFVREFVNPNVRHWPVFDGQDIGERPAGTMELGKDVMNRMLPQRNAMLVEESALVLPFEEPRATLLDMVNVRFLLVPRKGKTAEALRTLLQPPERYRVVHESDDGVVIERRSALPRAFLPERVEVVADADAAFDAIGEAGFDPRRVAFIEPSGAGRSIGPEGEGGAESGSARVIEREGAQLLLGVQASTPGWLVASIHPYPGLRAELVPKSGEPTELEVAPANGLLTAVRVPKGRFRVRFTYEPAFGRLAFWLVAAGAVLLLALTCWAVRQAAPTGASSSDAERG